MEGSALVPNRQIRRLLEAGVGEEAVRCVKDLNSMSLLTVDIYLNGNTRSGFHDGFGFILNPNSHFGGDPSIGDREPELSER